MTAADPLYLNRFVIVTRASEADMVRLLEEADDDTGVHLSGNGREYPVVNITRTDELPLGIDAVFERWFETTGVRLQYKDVARRTWFAGLHKGVDLMREGEVR